MTHCDEQEDIEENLVLSRHATTAVVQPQRAKLHRSVL